jgi:S-layer protein (TIGR01567 family)
MVGVVQAQELQYETVTKMAEDSDCAACHLDSHVIHEHTSATCQQCHGEKLTDNQPECNKCHSGTIHNAPTKTVKTSYEVLGAINATGTTFKATSIDNPAVLYYDLEDRDGYGSITFPLYDSLSVPKGELNYTTIPWGEYIGWGSSKYAVVYSSSSEWIIAKKLVDEDQNDDHIFRVGDTLVLPGGWSITVLEIDVDGTMAWILISKDGEEVYNKIVMEGDYFIYETDLGGPQESEIMNFTVETVFAGLNTNLVKINNIDLISKDILEIKNNDTNLYDGYVIKTSNNQISILNDIDISLSKGNAKNIISDLFSVRVNEAEDMAGLIKKITVSGIHEIVGATNASTGTMLMAMSADNPAVLYYDLEDKVGYESIRLPLYSNLSVPVGEMNYTTISWEQNIAWGSSKYVVVNSSSSNWIITKILIDEDQDDDHILRVGDTLVLQGGWSITVLKIDVDGEEAWMSISKDGEEVYNNVVTDEGYFIYETDLGGPQVSEVMNFTLETVFAGMNTNLVKFNNINLISTDVLNLNNNDATLYDGYIIKTYQDQLSVINDVDIGLSEGTVTNIIGNLFTVKVNEAGNLGALVKEVKVDEYVSPIKYLLKDGNIYEGDGYQINNYFVEITDITQFSGDLLCLIKMYQLNSDGSYDELTTSTILFDDKRRVKYQDGLIKIFVLEKNLSSQYAIVDIAASGFTVEYKKHVIGGVSNAQYYTSGHSPYSYTMTLLQGWNLVSTPIVPDYPDVDTIYGSNEDVLIPVYTWSTTDKKYDTVDKIELGKGYWVLALNDTQVIFSGTPYSG